MKFRTEIELPRSSHRIAHGDGGVMLLGSCFSDNIGERLCADGFDACHNPMGPLYNPASLHGYISRLLDEYIYSETDLTRDADGRWHALDFPLRYSGNEPDSLLDRINAECLGARERLACARTLAVTFGTAWCFEVTANGKMAGNCHKLPASYFRRRCMTPSEIIGLWQPLADRLLAAGKHLIATVSPIRHLSDGLHGNQISKATLLLALNGIAGMEYFPSYEIMLDDLRDYRFYADDLKHPSPMAVDYIYDIFSQTYFSNETLAEARRLHAIRLREAHRPLL